MQGVVEISKEKDQLLAAKISSEDAKVAAMDAKAMTLTMDSREIMHRCEEKLQSLIALNADLADASVKQAKSNSAMAVAFIVVAIGIGTILMLALGVVLSKSISKTLATLIAQTRGG